MTAILSQQFNASGQFEAPVLSCGDNKTSASSHSMSTMRPGFINREMDIKNVNVTHNLAVSTSNIFEADTNSAKFCSFSILDEPSLYRHSSADNYPAYSVSEQALTYDVTKNTTLAENYESSARPRFRINLPHKKTLEVSVSIFAMFLAVLLLAAALQTLLPFSDNVSELKPEVAPSGNYIVKKQPHNHLPFKLIRNSVSLSGNTRFVDNQKGVFSSVSNKTLAVTNTINDNKRKQSSVSKRILRVSSIMETINSSSIQVFGSHRSNKMNTTTTPSGVNETYYRVTATTQKTIQSLTNKRNKTSRTLSRKRKFSTNMSQSVQSMSRTTSKLTSDLITRKSYKLSSTTTRKANSSLIVKSSLLLHRTPSSLAGSSKKATQYSFSSTTYRKNLPVINSHLPRFYATGKVTNISVRSVIITLNTSNHLTAVRHTNLFGETVAKKRLDSQFRIPVFTQQLSKKVPRTWLPRNRGTEENVTERINSSTTATKLIVSTKPFQSSTGGISDTKHHTTTLLKKTISTNVTLSSSENFLFTLRNNRKSLKFIVKNANKTSTSQPTSAAVVSRSVPLLTTSLPRRPLICTLTALALSSTKYPKEWCTHLIYLSVLFDFENSIFYPFEESPSYNVFLSTSHSERGQGSVNYLLGLSQDFVRLYNVLRLSKSSVKNMEHYLRFNYLHGLALVNQYMDLKSAPLYSQIFKMFDRYMPGSTNLIFGFSTMETFNVIENALVQISKAATYVVLETHVKKFPDPCLAVFPSVYGAYRNKETTKSLETWSQLEALSSIAMLRNLSEVPNWCVSVSMDVLMYVIAPGLAKVASQRCTDFAISSYDRICHLQDNVHHVKWAKSASLETDDHLYLFEDVDSLSSKVSSIRIADKSVCLLVDHVDFDDPSGHCGVPFRRVSTVRKMLDESSVDAVFGVTTH